MQNDSQSMLLKAVHRAHVHAVAIMAEIKGSGVGICSRRRKTFVAGVSKEATALHKSDIITTDNIYE